MIDIFGKMRNQFMGFYIVNKKQSQDLVCQPVLNQMEIFIYIIFIWYPTLTQVKKLNNEYSMAFFILYIILIFIEISLLKFHSEDTLLTPYHCRW